MSTTTDSQGAAAPPVRDLGSVILRNGERLVIRPEEVQDRVAGVDYEHLLLQPGDGLVTRDSQLGRGLDVVPGQPGGTFPLVQSFFLCEQHDQLSVNPYFQNNLLNFLLAH